MSRTDRLTGIILALRGGRQTAAQLAARFEVSRRTILRDIDALGEIGVPVVTSPGAGGGLELAEGYWLPPLHLTAGEATLLLLALGALGTAEGSPFGADRRSVEEKLRAALRPDVVREAEAALETLTIAPAEAVIPEEHLRLLRNAVRRGTWLRVGYRSVRRQAEHLLQPRRLWLADGRWYCLALSLEAVEERRFRLDRMTSVEPIPPPVGAEAAERAVASSGVAYDDSSHPEVVVCFNETGLLRSEHEPVFVESALQVGERLWESRFRCPPAELAYYARVIYGLGADAWVVAPDQLRALVVELGRSMLLRYQPTGP